jgi:hypothetical protein
MKKLIPFLLAVFAVLVFSYETSAMVDAYLIKDDQGNVYEYDLTTLENSFMEHYFDKESEGAAYYLDFISNLMNHGFYSFHDSTGKYVDYQELESYFLENYATFDLKSYTESDQAAVVTDLEIVKKVTMVNGEIVMEEEFVDGPSNEAPEVISIQ